MKKLINDISGRTFGYCKVIKRVDNKTRGDRGRVVYECECLACGKSYQQYQDLIVLGYACGCISKNRDLPEVLKNDFTNDTQLSKIKSVPTKSNKSGVVGVNWDKSRSKWQASIRYQGKKYNIGRYDSFDDAVAARKLAETEFFEPLLNREVTK